MHVHLSTLGPIRAALTFQDLSVDTKKQAFKSRVTLPLKGASHEIEMGQIWYQKKDLEKLELRGKVIVSTDACARSY